VKNKDFSYENFNLNENFQQPDIKPEVFSRITKTINLLRISKNLNLKKYFANWVFVCRSETERQNLLNKIDYKLVKLITFWSDNTEAESNVNVKEAKKVNLALEEKKINLVKVVADNQEETEKADKYNESKQEKNELNGKFFFVKMLSFYFNLL